MMMSTETVSEMSDFVLLIMMMQTEAVSETSQFYSVLTRLTARKEVTLSLNIATIDWLC